MTGETGRTPPRLAAVVGPTATGKTQLGVELALRFGGEVVSVDSMQVYRGMDIGTAKPTAQEMRGVAHHMLDVAQPEESYSVARYAQQACACVEDILARGKLPVLVGGTGLYFDALLSGRPFAAAPDESLRTQLRARMDREGANALLRELAEIDPQSAARLHPGDEKRILRALEVWRQTGKTITQHNEDSRRLPPRYEALTIALDFQNREDLWCRIDARVDQMMERGLADEVSTLLRRGVPRSCTAMQAIGYKELAAALLSGGDLAAAALEIKLRSRQYAKRQRTWFRRRENMKWICWDKNPNFTNALLLSTEFLTENGLG